MSRIRIEVPAELGQVLEVMDNFPLPRSVRRLDTYLNLRTGFLATPLQSRTTGRTTIVEARTGDACVSCIEDALFLIGELPDRPEDDVDGDQRDV